MLSYTYVTDIVRHADELGVLRAALERVREGITLLDADMNIQFMNRAVRELWKIDNDSPDWRPNISDLIGKAITSGIYDVSRDQLPNFIAQRIARIRSGDPAPIDIRTGDGRIIRAQCDRLPSGGRMLTYCDVTDLVRSAEKMEALATIDPATGIANRRQFLTMAEAEWGRFQRYQRPLSMLIVDLDRFKTVNDRYGHDAGDAALRAVAAALQVHRRASDVAARIGGDEFALLLPETDVVQAALFAERICATIRDQAVSSGQHAFNFSVSVGVATATLGMAGAAFLIKAADEALYRAKSQGRDRVAVRQPDAAPASLAAE
jgi:diguanylate cyclase (GGDEF)-like protein